ncbi:hypothetical protein QWZ16_00370 [Vibrio ostreicida]|uniref:Uncharacterized protein n=1 Tax=Vibrio ostreicida TaxID=526588 RepID=A0ABT8BPQ6_9VIBR|nr:hypothetical protein [Vibrio ostreicida]MDN3608240.1 hypothetical protein [Vibrio ostreicida]
MFFTSLHLPKTKVLLAEFTQWRLNTALTTKTKCSEGDIDKATAPWYRKITLNHLRG